MSTEEKDEDLKISEETDGSVTVELPEGSFAEETEGDEEKQTETAQADAQEDEDQPGDTDAVREARRARRRAKKEYIKKTQLEKDHKIIALTRENEEIKQRLAQIERRTHSFDVDRLEKAIQDEESRINYAKVRLKEATENSDGQAAVRAQELFFEAKQKLDQLRAYKSKFEKEVTAAPEAPNPVVKSLAERWMEQNDWYDPESGDTDSRIAKRLDQQLSAEGWNPASTDYWNELTRRLQKELPHRYTDDSYETPRKRGPRSVVTGSERETGGGASRGTFTLTADQVRAMKDAGFWDDPKQRQKMIKRYAEQARQTRS